LGKKKLIVRRRGSKISKELGKKNNQGTGPYGKSRIGRASEGGAWSKSPVAIPAEKNRGEGLIPRRECGSGGKGGHEADQIGVSGAA